jgi:hypothetical protein
MWVSHLLCRLLIVDCALCGTAQPCVLDDQCILDNHTQVEPLVAPHMVSLLERSLRLVVSERDPYGHLQVGRCF